MKASKAPACKTYREITYSIPKSLREKTLFFLVCFVDCITEQKIQNIVGEMGVRQAKFNYNRVEERFLQCFELRPIENKFWSSFLIIGISCEVSRKVS